MSKDEEGIEVPTLNAVDEDKAVEVVNPVFSRDSSLDTPIVPTRSQRGGLRRVSATPSDMSRLSLIQRDDTSHLDRLKQRLIDVTTSRPYYMAYFVATVYCLFMDEVRILAAPKSADEGMQAALFVAFLMFIFEMLVLCWVQPTYFPHTFFWMDIIALFSIVIDIPWMADPLLGMFGEDSVQALSITRASRC
jgi:hypothetical protein